MLVTLGAVTGGNSVIFEVQGLLDYSDDAMVAEVRRVVSPLPDGPISLLALAEVSSVSKDTLRRRFGGWVEAHGVGNPLSVPIDSVFVVGGLTLRNLQPGLDLGSDRLPLIAEIGTTRIIAEAE